MRTPFAAAALAAVLATCPAAAEPFTFVAIGDVPYGKPEDVYGKYELLIAAINAANPAFTIHVGDIKSGSTECSDKMLGEQLAFLNSFASALVYTPGDNEWTDCYRANSGGFDPLERLAYLRTHFFPGPRSLGAAPIDLERQAELMPDAATFVENARFSRDGVLFVTAHVVGSNNNFEVRDPAAVAEYFARDAANVAWLKDSFAKAVGSNAPAIVVAIQADMFEFDFDEFDDETFLRHSGFKNFGEALVKEAAAYGKPVLLVFGDSHIHRVFRPFPKTAGNIMAVEVYGDADYNAVEIMVDVEAPAVFAVRTIPGSGS